MVKKTAKNISNNKIDNIYDYGIKNGAIGGKLLGAGNGGFILFLVKKNNRKKFIEKFKKNIIVPVKIDTTGNRYTTKIKFTFDIMIKKN